MEIFAPRNTPNSIPFTAMMESGLLVEEDAEVVQTQVVAHGAGASIRNRNAVPEYEHVEEGSNPSWKTNRLIETGLSRPPGMDSRFCLEDSYDLHIGIRNQTVQVGSDSLLRSHSVAIVANVAGVIIFMFCAWVASLNFETNPPAPPQEQAAQVQKGGVQHGPVDSVTDVAQPLRGGGDGAVPVSTTEGSAAQQEEQEGVEIPPDPGGPP